MVQALWQQNWTTSDLVDGDRRRRTTIRRPAAGRPARSGARPAARPRRCAAVGRVISRRSWASRAARSCGAYEQLIAEGYLVALAGGRTRVSSLAARRAAARGGARPAATHGSTCVPECPTSAASRRRTGRARIRRGGRPVRSADLGYGDGRGTPIAREVVAGAPATRACGRRRAGLPPRAANGFAQCVSLIVGVSRRAACGGWPSRIPGIVRSTGSRGRRFQFSCPSRSTTTVSLVDLLAACGADAVLITPAHQSPTGAVLSAERRSR